MGNRERSEPKPNYGEILLSSNIRYPEEEQWTICFIVRIQVIGISLIRIKRHFPWAAFTSAVPHANGRNIVGQQLPTLLDVKCCVRLHTLLHVVAQSLKPVKLLHGSSNIVWATHAHYTWSHWRLQSLMGFILLTMHCRS